MNKCESFGCVYWNEHELRTGKNSMSLPQLFRKAETGDSQSSLFGVDIGHENKRGISVMEEVKQVLDGLATLECKKVHFTGGKSL